MGSPPAIISRLARAKLFAMDREARAAARRLQWAGGTVKAGEGAAFERKFWRTSSAEQRMAAVWAMAQQWWQLQHPNEPSLRLDRSVGGLRRVRR